MSTMTEVATAVFTLRSRALRLTKNHADADDLVQDTFLRAVRFLDVFVDGNIVAWLNTMMFRLFLSGKRVPGGKKNVYSYHERVVSIETLPNFDIPYDPKPAAEWDLQRALAVIDRLPPKHRDPMHMLLNDASYKEISAALRWPLDTTKTRMKHARATLRQQLQYENSPLTH